MNTTNTFSDELNATLDHIYHTMCSGHEIYENIQSIRPDRTDVIVCPGHMGDTLWVAALASEYVRQRDCDQVYFAIVESQNEMVCMFPDIASTVILDAQEMHDLQMYIGEMQLWDNNHIVYAHFRGHYILRGFSPAFQQIITYRANSSILDVKKDALGLTGEIKTSRMTPPDDGNDAELAELFNRSVLLVPVSKSLKGIPEEFWKNVADEYSAAGFKVYTNYNGFEYEKMVEGTTPISSSLTELATIAPYFTQVIAYRSGACDLIAETEANLSIVYDTRHPDRGVELTRDDWILENIYDLVDRERLLNYQYIEGREIELIAALLRQSVL